MSTDHDIRAVLADASRLRTELAATTRQLNRTIDDRVVSELEAWLADPQRSRDAIELLGVLRPSYAIRLVRPLIRLMLSERYTGEVLALFRRVPPDERDGPLATEAILLYESRPDLDTFRRLLTLFDHTNLHRPAAELADLALTSDDPELRDEAADHLAGSSG